jgi:putative transposase
MDETYIQVKAKWYKHYKAVDQYGKTIDFMLSAKRDEAEAIDNINLRLIINGLCKLMIADIQVKSLNNIVEQDHRFIKK